MVLNQGAAKYCILLLFAGIPYETYQQLAPRAPRSGSLPMYGCRQKFFLKKGAVNQKRLRNTELERLKANGCANESNVSKIQYLRIFLYTLKFLN